MNLLNKLERKWGRFAIPNLAIYLVGGQGIMFLLIMLQRVDPNSLVFQPGAVLAGEVQRLLGFVFMPFSFSWFSLLIGLWIFYMLSNALEQTWGSFKYNAFILLGIIINVGTALCLAPWFPYMQVTSYFLYLTVFFAFATLYPNYEFLLFFVLPVKVKYLAMISACLFVLMPLLVGQWGVKIAALASVGNYLLFFGKGFAMNLHYRKRRTQFHAKQKEVVEECFHTCSVCGATDKSHPEREFRYREGKGICSKCLKEEAK